LYSVLVCYFGTGAVKQEVCLFRWRFQISTAFLRNRLLYL